MKPAKGFKKKADDLFSKIVRSVGYCEWCGSTNSQLHTHHIISRKWSLLRHLFLNAVCLCVACHRKVHDGDLEWASWLHTVRNKSDLEYLQSLKHSIPKMDWEAVYNRLKLENEGRLK